MLRITLFILVSFQVSSQTVTKLNFLKFRADVVSFKVQDNDWSELDSVNTLILIKDKRVSILNKDKSYFDIANYEDHYDSLNGWSTEFICLDDRGRECKIYLFYKLEATDPYMLAVVYGDNLLNLQYMYGVKRID